MMTYSLRFLPTLPVCRWAIAGALLALLGTASSSLAAEYHWQGDGSQTSDFNQPLWSKGKPGDADYVAANAGPPGAGDTAYTNGASLTVSSGGVDTLHIEGGTLTVAANFPVRQLDSTGVITGTGTLIARALGAYDATTPGASGGTTLLRAGHVETASVLGSVNVTQGSTLRVTDANASAKLNLFGADVVSVDGTSQALVGRGNFGAAGTLRIAAGGQVTGIGTLAAHVIVASSGLLSAPVGDADALNIQGDLDLTDGGTTVGASVTNVKLIVASSGLLSAPVGDADALNIQGDLDLTDGGTTVGASVTNVKFQGQADPVQIVVTGQATLGGTLYVDYRQGYAPNVGDNLTFLKAGSVVGKFQIVTSFGTPAKAKKSADKTSAYLKIVSVTPGLPVQTGSVDDSATLGDVYAYTISGTKDINGYSAQGLPPGLSLDSQTGVISGIPAQAGDFPVYLILSNNQATGAGYFDLTVNDAPPATEGDGTILTAVATVPFAYEAEQSRGIITVTRTGDTTASLDLTYAVQGSAVAGVDYKALSGGLTIPAGSKTAKIRVKALDVHITGYGVKTVKITLRPRFNYTVGTPASAKVKIYDDDLPD